MQSKPEKRNQNPQKVASQILAATLHLICPRNGIEQNENYETKPTRPLFSTEAPRRSQILLTVAWVCAPLNPPELQLAA